MLRYNNILIYIIIYFIDVLSPYNLYGVYILVYTHNQHNVMYIYMQLI